MPVSKPAIGQSNWGDTLNTSLDLVSPQYNVRDPQWAGGAKGDGTTDDTAAIQACIDGSTQGAVIIFPPGVYVVSAPIRFTGDRTYRGAGFGLTGNASRIQLAAGVNIGSASGVTGLFVSREWYANEVLCGFPTRFEDLWFDGNRDNNPTGQACGLVIYNFWTHVVRCSFESFNKDAIHFTDTCSDGTTTMANTASENAVERCKINFCTGSGIRQRSTANPDANLDGYIEACLISGCGVSAIQMDRAAGWSIRRCHLYAIEQTAVDLSNCYATAVSQNYIEDFGVANAAGITYTGIRMSMETGRACQCSENTVYCGEPAGTATFVYYDIGTQGGATNRINVTDNIAGGLGTGRGRGMYLSTASGGTLAMNLTDNDISGMGTDYTTFSAGVLFDSETFGHINFRGNAPTVAAVAGGTGAGTSPPTPTVMTNSTDATGGVNFGTGTTAWGTGAYVTVTFDRAFSHAPFVTLIPGNQATAVKQPYVTTVTTTGFQIGLGVAATAQLASGSYVVHYHALG